MSDKQRKLKDRASKAFGDNKLKDALKLYQQVVDEDPTEIACRLKIGDIHRKLGQKKEAVEAYEPVARHYAEDGLLLKAIAVGKLILSVDPSHTRTQEMLANLYSKREGRHDYVPRTAREMPSGLGFSPSTREIDLDDGSGGPMVIERGLPPQGADLEARTPSPTRPQPQPQATPMLSWPVAGGAVSPADSSGPKVIVGQKVDASVEPKVIVGTKAAAPEQAAPKPTVPAGFAWPVAQAMPQAPVPTPQPTRLPMGWPVAGATPIVQGTPGDAAPKVVAGVPVTPPAGAKVELHEAALDAVDLARAEAAAAEVAAELAVDVDVVSAIEVPADLPVEVPASAVSSASAEAPLDLLIDEAAPEDAPPADEIILDEPIESADVAPDLPAFPAPIPGVPVLGAAEDMGIVFAEDDESLDSILGDLDDAPRAPAQASGPPTGEVELQASALVDLDEADLAPDRAVEEVPVPLEKRITPSRPPDPELKSLGLPQIPLFSDLPKEAFISILVEMQMRELSPGEYVIRQGEVGDSFFVLATGRVRVERKNEDDTSTVLAYLTDGAFFGEMALLQDGARVASVVVEEEAQVFEIGRKLLDRIVKQFPAVERVVRNFYMQRLLSTTMATHPLFKSFSLADRRDLMARFKSRGFKSGDVLVKEAQKGEGLYLLLTGKAEVTKLRDGESLMIAELGAGDMFGEMSLLANRPTVASVTATSECIVLRLSRRDFDEVIMTHPQVLELVAKISEERETENSFILGGWTSRSEGGVALV